MPSWKGLMIRYLLLCAFLNAATYQNATAQNKGDSLVIERITLPRYMSGRFKKGDVIIERRTIELIKKDLDRYDEFKSVFSSLERENDSLFQALNAQMEQLRQLYSTADLLQQKLLNNQIELIRAEEELMNYQARYNNFVESTEAETKIKYRTRYIFRDKQEKRWFWITWGIFLSVPTSVIVWQMNK